MLPDLFRSTITDLMIRATLLAVLISQGAWVYAQVGWVICIHEGGQALAEPSGDLCCGPEKARSLDREEDNGSAFLVNDPCPCSDFSLSVIARHVVTRSAPSDLEVQTEPCEHFIGELPNPAVLSGCSRLAPGDDPPGTQIPDILKTVVLRI